MKIGIYRVHKVLTEGTAEDVAQLQAQITAIDTQVARVTQPLQARKSRLATMLAQKQKQMGNEQKQQAAQQTPAQNTVQ